MSTLFENIERIQLGKEKLKTSIENKNVVVPDDMLINDYYSLVDQIQTGSPIDLSAITFTNLTNAFLDSNVVDVSPLNFSNVKDCYFAFRGTTSLSHFTNDISQATSMYYAFAWSGLSYAELNCNSATNFNGCFRYCENLNTLQIRMGNATDIGEMLLGCTSLVNLSLPSGISSNSEATSLTLDLTSTAMTVDSFRILMDGIGLNFLPTAFYTRIIKITDTLYDALTDDIFDAADSKHYTLAT